MATKKKIAAKKSARKKIAVKKVGAAKRPVTPTVTANKSVSGTARRQAAKSSSASKKAAVRSVMHPAPDPKQLAHGLRALLHTMQTVQRFEESLCSMMHALERGRSGAALQRELRATLEALPVHDYRDDVEDLMHALG